MNEEHTQSRRNVFKSKWSKIIKSEEDPNKANTFDSSVTDFLRGTQQPVATVPAPPVSTRPIVSPRIDVNVAQRWPDATQLRQAPSDEYRVPSPLPAETTGRGRKRKGLTVRFATTPPEVIGHGGEETRAPPMEIGQNKPAIARSKSERRPDEPLGMPAVLQDRSPRPGMGDRAQTHQGNNEAYSRLMSAGVFADRPPSRDNRYDDADDADDPQPGMLNRTQTGFSTIEDDSPSTPEDEDTLVPSYSPARARKPVPPPEIREPHMVEGGLADEPLPSGEWDPDHDRVPRVLRKSSQDAINKTQQRMRLEEAQAFSRAYRLSQVLPDDFDASRSPSQQSDHSFPSRNLSTATESASRRMDVHEAMSSQESLSMRRKPPPSPTMPTGQQFLRPNASQAYRDPSPHEPRPAQARKPAPHPQDYIEFFKSKTQSRSNTTASRGPSHDEPRQLQPPAQLSEPRRSSDQQRPSIEVPSSMPANLQYDSHHEEPEGYLTSPRGAHARKPIPPKAAKPVTGSPEDHVRHSPPDQYGRHRANKASVENIHSSPDTPVRRVDPVAAAALEDFGARVNQMKGVFRLTAQKERSESSIPEQQWIRCAFWWLHKGRMQLEQQARSPQRGLLTQAHVDVAKSWWIATEVIDEGEVATDANDAEDLTELMFHLQMTALRMERQDCMPPPASLIQGQDTKIWLIYPSFSPDLAYLLGCTTQTTRVAETLPLGDTKDYFFYKSLPVIGSVSTDDQATDRVRLPCVLSILRHRLHYRASILVASQNNLVNALVGPDLGKEKQGPTWYDIAWKSKSSAMSINLPRGLVLNVSLDEQDYRSLSSMIEYTRTMDKSFHPAPGETLIFSSQLKDAQHFDRGKDSTFPEGRIRRAFVGVFQEVQVEKSQNTTRKAHRAYRLMLITPSTSRTLGVESHPFDGRAPFVLDLPDGSSPGAEPVIILHSADRARPWRLVLTFDSKQPFNELLDLLHGTFMIPDEYTAADLALRSYSVTPLVTTPTMSATPPHPVLSVTSHLQWRDAMIVNRRSDRPSTILSDSLRLVLNHSCGTLTDRLNLGPGELLLRLPVDTTLPAIELARAPQPDIQLAMNRSETPPGALDALLALPQALATSPTLRTLTFTTLQDLHAFQQEVTGYRVLLDTTPQLFAITRRHKVVTLHKKLEATHVRLQVLSKSEGSGKEVQIAAFFEDFPSADAMVFVVKGSDEVERVSGGKGAKYGVRLVEAKFSLPGKVKDKHKEKGEMEEEVAAEVTDVGIPESAKRRFVNLEGLEYMEEHDDIVIGFENESDADRFCEALPCTVHAAGRSFLSKRR